MFVQTLIRDWRSVFQTGLWWSLLIMAMSELLFSMAAVEVLLQHDTEVWLLTGLTI